MSRNSSDLLFGKSWPSHCSSQYGSCWDPDPPRQRKAPLSLRMVWRGDLWPCSCCSSLAPWPTWRRGPSRGTDRGLSSWARAKQRQTGGGLLDSLEQRSDFLTKKSSKISRSCHESSGKITNRFGKLGKSVMKNTKHLLTRQAGSSSFLPNNRNKAQSLNDTKKMQRSELYFKFTKDQFIIFHFNSVLSLRMY